jgi:poly(3-hydroxybutyrate) depolymerase
LSLDISKYMITKTGRKTLVIVFALSLIFLSCSSNNNRKDQDKFELGKVIPKVICKKDITISYALYLPSNYSEEKKFPVIIAFDAHAKGIKPVELFHEMAEKYGYIVIGSNNSQNGMQSDETMRIYDLVSDDALTRFSIDQTRIYTAGFSGGSRVASSVAIFKGGICGVIGCSAGFPSVSQPIQFKFDYIGFVGDEDMNYLEMVTLEDALKQSGYRHQLIIFQGKHDWPPKEYIADAFFWLEANAMKDLKKPKDKNFIDQVQKNWMDKAGELEKQGKNFDAYILYKKITNYFEGLTDLTVLKKKITSLEASPEIQKNLDATKENRKIELDLQSKYMKALGEKNSDWWRNEISRLNSEAEKSQDETKASIIYRVLGYLSLSAYSNSNAYLNAGQLEPAARFIELYSIIDPTNNEHAYLDAQLNVKKGNPDKAFASIEEAIKLGFNDYGRFQGDTVLARLKTDTRYFDILERLKQSNQ